MSPNDPVIQRALHYLRDFHEPGGTYETSLMIMALVAAHEWDRDKLRIASLAQKLETMQTQKGRPLLACGITATANWAADTKTTAILSSRFSACGRQRSRACGSGGEPGS